MGETGRVSRPREQLPCGPVHVRRWRRTDLAALVAATHASWRHLQPWLPWAQDEPDAPSSLAYLERCDAEWEAGEAFHYAVVATPESDAVLGSCSVVRRIGEGGLEIGYWVHAAHARRGLATAAATGLTSEGFTLPDVDRLEIHTDRANVPSRTVAGRLGYELVDVRTRAPQAPADTGQEEVWRLTRARWAATGQAPTA